MAYLPAKCARLMAIGHCGTKCYEYYYMPNKLLLKIIWQIM